MAAEDKKEIVIVIDEGATFEGSLKQFKDCFFDNANHFTIRMWCKQNGMKFGLRSKC